MRKTKHFVLSNLVFIYSSFFLGKVYANDITLDFSNNQLPSQQNWSFIQSGVNTALVESQISSVVNGTLTIDTFGHGALSGQGALSSTNYYKNLATYRIAINNPGQYPIHLFFRTKLNNTQNNENGNGLFFSAYTGGYRFDIVLEHQSLTNFNTTTTISNIDTSTFHLYELRGDIDSNNSPYFDIYVDGIKEGTFTSIANHNGQSLEFGDGSWKESIDFEINGLSYCDSLNYDTTTKRCNSQNNGCTDPLASNYDSTANFNDGSCIYNVSSGCTNIIACNYDLSATQDDGSCFYPKEICSGENDGTGNIISFFPELNLIGDSIVTINQSTNPSSSYTDPGASCFDQQDGNLNINVTGSNIDLSQAGTNIIIYSCTDSLGNTSTKERVVLVTPTTGDVNQDGITNILDIIMTVNLILNP